MYGVERPFSKAVPLPYRRGGLSAFAHIENAQISLAPAWVKRLRSGEGSERRYQRVAGSLSARFYRLVRPEIGVILAPIFSAPRIGF